MDRSINPLQIAKIIAITVVLAFAGWKLLSPATEQDQITFINTDNEINQILVEIANSDKERQIGLMGLEELKENHGMLFIFPEEQILSFWMKNTLIPLDMIFLNENKQIITIHQNVPPCTTSKCPTYQSSSPAMYVIEVNAGFVDKHAVSEQTIIRF